MFRSKSIIVQPSAVARVLQNRGCCGVDGIPVQTLTDNHAGFLANLQSQLQTDSYLPLPLRSAQIESTCEGRHKLRQLAIPNLADRLLATQARSDLQPLAESRFEEASHGYRTLRGVATALASLARIRQEGFRFILDADIVAFFDSIPHDPLLKTFTYWFSARNRWAPLLSLWLSRPLWNGRHLLPARRGIAQGCPLSPLLANLYLHSLDEVIRSHGWRMVRYADDFLVLTRSSNDLDLAHQIVSVWLGSAGLRLHPGKTHLRPPEASFPFLGHLIHQGLPCGPLARIRTSRLRNIAPIWTAADFHRFGYSTANGFTAKSIQEELSWLQWLNPTRFFT